ncbi:MAG: hypothetical protein AB7O96_11520 [Pseudobdellovibrionaceae bacterium]
MSNLEMWELASYIVTVVGLPFAIGVFMFEQNRERQNEDEEIYQRLSDEYAEFSKIMLENADLRLLSPEDSVEVLSGEQKERKKIMFDLLISLFERAFILVYEEEMRPQTKRLWASWDDYIRSWCKRRDFRESLKELLSGEDPEFVAYVQRIANEEANGSARKV